MNQLKKLTTFKDLAFFFAEHVARAGSGSKRRVLGPPGGPAKGFLSSLLFTKAQVWGN